MSEFVWGLITMGYAIAGLFFLRFWTRTREGLFAAFAVAFWLLALNQALVAVSAVPREEQTPFYLLRLAAFGIIIGAIVMKNLRARSR
ncbi:DUF5985 family protein [Salinarimonas soli]|uniref:Uncharacterized protein n=1 Tax=Salinarimonas soli TaxID=1638099 RepID=A0A5B2V5F1_9HYPH|nr:DUF5985 family protein [Salinarimonas soli]KAA2234161.1 hypothetical protein F0L46_24210 [Salinarimonas soli]